MARYVMAMVKASFSAPEDYVRSGVVRLFEQKDAHDLKRNPNVALALKIMREARDLLEKMKIKDNHKAKYELHVMDVRIVMTNGQKKVANRKAFSSLLEIAQAFYDRVVEKMADVSGFVSCPTPWAFVQIASAAPESQKDSLKFAGGIRELAQDSVISKKQAVEHGYKVNMVVTLQKDSKETKNTYLIKAMADDGVTLQRHETGQKDDETMVDYAALVSEYDCKGMVVEQDV